VGHAVRSAIPATAWLLIYLYCWCIVVLLYKDVKQE